MNVRLLRGILHQADASRYLRSTSTRLVTGLGIVGSVVGVATIPLIDWESVVQAWSGLSRHFYLGLAVIVSAALGTWGGRRSTRSVDYLEPKDHSGMGDVTPSGIEARLMRLLSDSSLRASGGIHVLRIVLLGGGSTLHYLDHISRTFPWPGQWEIRVLIIDPDSPIASLLGPGANEELAAGVAKLKAIAKRCDDRKGPVSVAWRTYSERPFFRGGLIDRDHLFTGYFILSDDSDGVRLVEQNKRLAYFRSRNRFGADTIDAFIGEFDRRWDLGGQ